jgi:putative tryptophan/tyrosine transport system substrate-binding protein
MKKILCAILSFSALLVVGATALAADSPPAAPEKTIGIVLPMDHVALRAIVKGFEESAAKNYPGKIRFEVQDAEHDLNIQRAIIQKFINQKVDLVVPVATGVTQMAISMVKNQPILGLAAMIPDSTREQNGLDNRLTGVRDEIDSAKQLAFMRAILPNMKKLTLIYSADDKVIPEVKNTIQVAKQYNIAVQPLMIQNLSDLYSASRRVDADSQAIFILKDSLVASGINTIVNNASKRHLPIISSDEGSVSGGAGAALGVEEQQIGIEGGELAAKILTGQPISQLPIQAMRQLLIFVNTKAAAAQGLNIDAIKQYAREQNYAVKLNPGAAG